MSVFDALTEGMLALYYPQRAIRGRVPNNGVYIIVANHPNGLLDPLMVRLLLKPSGGPRPGFLGKSTFWDNPVGAMVMDAAGAMPVYRAHEADTSKNEHTFARCRTLLSSGGWLALFPEGKSHSEPTLQPLKTGAARIALSTLAEHPELPLRILPVGVFYEAKAVFRSRAAGTVGEPVEVRDLVERYGIDPSGAVDALTERVEAALSAVVLQGETDELRRGFFAVAGWTLARQASSGSQAPVKELAQQEAKARELAKLWARSPEEQRLQAVAAFTQFERRMAELGVDDPLSVLSPNLTRVAATTLGLLALAPIAALGAVWGWAPYRLVRPGAERLAAGSDDVLGTIKVLLGALVMGVHTLAVAGIVGWFGGWAAGLAALLVGPMSGYMALRFDERWALRVDALRGAWRARDSEVREAVARERDALVDAVGASPQVSGYP